MPEIYLSRVVLDPRQHLVQRALADCHALHRDILAAFPVTESVTPRQEFGVLYRIDVEGEGARPVLLLQSRVRPFLDRGVATLALPGEPPRIKDVSAAYAGIEAGQRLRFRLRANPTRVVNASRAGQDPLAGKRVELRTDAERTAWLERKAGDAGFRVLEVRVGSGGASGGKQRGRKGGGPDLTFGVAVFDGVLEVEDAERFRAALEQGIGSGKGYGFGLLSIARTG